MGLREIIQFAITFTGIVGAFLINKIAEVQNKSFLDISVYLVLLSVLIYGLTFVFEKEIFNSKKREFLEKYKFENMVKGIWIESYEVNQEPMYALIEIQFDKNITKLSLKGTAYDSNGVAFSNWNTLEIYPDNTRNNLLYIYTGQFQDRELNGKGYGELNFSGIHNENIYSFATGYFSDEFTGFKPVTFNIDRLSEEQCQSFCNKSIIESSIDRVNLIQNYHKSRRNGYF